MTAFEQCPKCGEKPVLSGNTITGEGYAACKCCKGESVKSIEPNQSDRFFDMKEKAFAAWNKKVRKAI
jgi:hypothetical protein